MNKDNYFLNLMKPGTHIFMKRLLVHLRNKKKNKEEIKRQQETIRKHGVAGRMGLDAMGRIIIVQGSSCDEGTIFLDEIKG